MMRTSILLLLLATAFVPTIVAANPVFHCRTTGSESFVMECCDPASTAAEAAPLPSCCAHHEVEPIELRSGDKNGSGAGKSGLVGETSACSCCDISFIRLVTLDPRAESADASTIALQILSSTSPAWVALPTAPRSVLPPAQLTRRRGPPPPLEPPLPILHAALRL